MSFDSPVSKAALAWGLMVAIAITLTASLRFLKLVDKDSAGIAYVFIVTAGISTFMLWVCAWMQQWHPLIPVVFPSKEE